MAISADEVRRVVAPVVAAAGLDLEDVVVRPAGRRTVVRVIVDADGGVSLDDIAAVSGAVSDSLDESAELGESQYTLEVTSPGVDRPLTEERHWRRAIGRLVSAQLADGTTVVGRVRSATATVAELDVKGALMPVAYDTVTRATVQVEFSAPAEAAAASQESAPAEAAGASQESAPAEAAAASQESAPAEAAAASQEEEA